MTDTDSKTKNSTAPEVNIWNSILSEASRAVADRLEQRTVLLLGERNSGKSSLLARLQGIDMSEAGKGVALDYSYIDITATNEMDDEPIARLNVWQLEGEEEHKHLLKFALNAETVANSLVVITLDFSQPWDLLLSLQRWLSILESHLQTVYKQLDKSTVDDMKQYQISDFQSYSVPTATSVSSIQKVAKKKKVEEGSNAVPLSEDVLVHNLGIPIIVCVTKTDSVFQLEKEWGFRDPHFEYIHPMLRKVCLSYGASLIYTSSKKDRNIDVLMKYITHKLYGFEFIIKPIMEIKETMFIPSGYDSMNKIKIDFDSQTLTKEFDGPFEDIIKIPKSLILEAENDEPFIVAEEDQEYLENWKEVVDKEPAKSAKPQVVQAVGTGMTSTPTTPDKPPPPTSTPSPVASSPMTPDAKQQEHQAFANFFSNLMNRDTRSTNIAPLSLPGNLASRLPTSPALKATGGSPAATTSPSTKINTTLGGLSNEEIAKALERVKGGKP